MSKRQITEAERLVTARDTLKVVWVAYVNRTLSGILRLDEAEICVALEVALDELDLALLRLDAELSFELTDGNENDSQ